MTVHVDVAPELLQWAVDRAGWDIETAERRVPLLESWIDGTRQPTLKQLESFANATHTPFGLLFLSEPPEENVPIPDMRTLGNIAVPQPSADLLDKIYQCQLRQDWYRTYLIDNEIDGPSFVGSATVNTSPAEVARKIQTLLNYDPKAQHEFTSWQDALRWLIDRIEDCGVLVMVNGIVGSDTHRKLNPDEFRGFALADRLAPLIFVNGADTKAAQIFTLIHELAHILLGESALSDTAVSIETGTQVETWCNSVAAEVLVPITALRTEYSGEPTEAELERLARRYRVSTLVILTRIYDAGLVPSNRFHELYKRERERVLGFLASQPRHSGGGNYYNTQPFRLSRQFARAVIASAWEGTTTFRDAYKLLGTKKHSTFEKLSEQLQVK